MGCGVGCCGTCVLAADPADQGATSDGAWVGDGAIIGVTPVGGATQRAAINVGVLAV